MRNDVNKTIQYNTMILPKNCHDDRLSHSSNSIKVTNSTIWEAAVLVLLTGEVYEACLWDSLRRHEIHATFYDDRFRYSSNITIITTPISEAAVLVLLIGGVYELRRWDGLKWHDISTKFHDVSTRIYSILMASGVTIHIPRVMKMGTVVRKLLDGGYTHTDRSVISYIYVNFFQNKERMLR
jgi:hypothetical protein